MQQILLVNPSRRGGKKKRARPGKSRRRTTSARRANPRRSARRSMRARAYRAVSRRRSRSVRRSRNPITMSGLKGMLMPAVWGGGGAVVTDIAYRLLPVPGALSILKGTLSPLTKVGVAFAVAKLGSMFVGAKNAQDMLSGSLAVIAYGLTSDLVLRYMPVISAPAAAPLSGSYDFAGLGYTSPGAVVQPQGRSGMGEYISEYISGSEYDFAGNG